MFQFPFLLSNIVAVKSAFANAFAPPVREEECRSVMTPAFCPLKRVASLSLLIQLHESGIYWFAPSLTQALRELGISGRMSL